MFQKKDCALDYSSILGDSLKTKMLVLLSILLLIASGCTQQASSNGQGAGTSGTAEEAGCPAVDCKESTGTGTAREFDVQLKRFEFSPGTITVKQGDRVKLNLTAVDVSHGFSLPDFGVSQNVEAGETVSVEFTASKTGTFTFRCSVFCGDGHASMSGTLIVEK